MIWQSVKINKLLNVSIAKKIAKMKQVDDVYILCTND